MLERIAQFKCKHGLAFSFLRDFGYCYVDLDDSRNPDTGELTGFASSIVKRLNSFTEISIGKAGLHVVVRGQVERTRMHTRKNWAGQQIEIKPYGCFMTVSGNRLESTPREVQDRQSELSISTRRYSRKSPSQRQDERKTRRQQEETAELTGRRVITPFAVNWLRLE